MVGRSFQEAYIPQSDVFRLKPRRRRRLLCPTVSIWSRFSHITEFIEGFCPTHLGSAGSHASQTFENIVGNPQTCRVPHNIFLDLEASNIQLLLCICTELLLTYYKVYKQRLVCFPSVMSNWFYIPNKAKDSTTRPPWDDHKFPNLTVTLKTSLGQLLCILGTYSLSSLIFIETLKVMCYRIFVQNIKWIIY